MNAVAKTIAAAGITLTAAIATADTLPECKTHENFRERRWVPTGTPPRLKTIRIIEIMPNGSQLWRYVPAGDQNFDDTTRINVGH